MIDLIKKQLKSIVPEDVGVEVFPSEKEEFGHYSTNVAFGLAPLRRRRPFEIAEDIVGGLVGNKNFEKVEAVNPGFVNFWLSPKVLQKELKVILKEKNKYGKIVLKKKNKINLEFVSANPTGPLTMANGRGGFFGDVLANALERAGNKVVREYYINDAGNQVRLLGEAALAKLGYIQEREELYKGKYVEDLAREFKKQIDDCFKKYPGRVDLVAQTIGGLMAKQLMGQIKKSLKAAGIKHDVWFSEKNNLYKKGELQKTLDFLKSNGLVWEKEGALWLGDAVLIKSDGNPTYFLADLAYHYDKFFKRKFDKAIDIWGADHHGYAMRMEKGVQVLKVDLRRLKIIITQLVRLVSEGKEVRMSKRKGEFVTMDQLLGEVGVDAARFFFLMHSPDTHMDFDLKLAKEKSVKNPVYYVQYAYVRAVNVLKKVAGAKQRASEVKLDVLNSQADMRLMLELVRFPGLIRRVAEDYQVHRLTKYASELAKAFHNFYEEERVAGVGGKEEKARAMLVLSTKIVLENLFGVLGISAPKSM